MIPIRRLSYPLGNTQEVHGRRLDLLRALDPKRYIEADSMAKDSPARNYDLNFLRSNGYIETMHETVKKGGNHMYLPTYDGLRLRRECNE